MPDHSYPRPADPTRPRTIAKILDDLAQWLDFADRAFAELARLKGLPEHPAKGTDVQNDLRALAEWMVDNPYTAERIREEVFP